MQTNQENQQTSSGVPVQMVAPQLSIQSQNVQNQNLNSQTSGPYSTMMYPTMTMAQSPLQQQMQTLQHSTNSEASVHQMVLPELTTQEQTPQSGNIPQSSSNHPLHSTMTISQPQLQDQMQAVHQNINAESGPSVQMVLPEMSTQAQAVQSGNIPQSSSSHPTIMYPTMTVAQQPLQHIQVIQQPLTAPYFQQLYSPQQMFFPSNVTYQHAGATATVQTLGTQGLQLQTKLPVLDPKNSFNGQTFQVINPVTKAFANQTLLPKPIYSSTLPLNSAQASNGSHLKQVTSQPQMFGSFSALPQGLTLAAPGNFTTASFLNPNSLIQNQQPEIILQSSSQTAMFLPVTAGTTPTIYTLVPPRKYSPRVRLKPSTVTSTQTGVMAPRSDAEKNKIPIPRFHPSNVPRQKGKIPIPFTVTIAQPTATTQATVETQTNQFQAQVQVAPEPNPTANFTQISLNQMVPVTPQVEVPTSKSIVPRTEASVSSSVQKLASVSVSSNVQTSNFVEKPVVAVASSTTTTTFSAAPVTTSVVHTLASCIPVISTAQPLTLPTNINDVHTLESVIIKKEPIEYSTDLNVENAVSKQKTSLTVNESSEPQEASSDPKTVENESVKHQINSKITVENDCVKHQADSKGVVEKESVEHVDNSSCNFSVEVEHKSTKQLIDSTEVECEPVKNQPDSIGTECDFTDHQTDSVGNEGKSIEPEASSREVESESTEHQTDSKPVSESELIKQIVDSKVLETLTPQVFTESINGHPNTPIEKVRLKAVVRPHILTHVIDGFVIYESSEPFPVSRSALMSEPPCAVPKEVDKKPDQKKSEKVKKSDQRRSIEPKKSERRKSADLKKVDQEEPDEPKEPDQRKPHEPKIMNPKKIVDEPKKLDPKKTDESKVADSKKPSELPVTPEEKLLKTPSKRGRKRKVLSSATKEEKQSPTPVLTNNVQRIEVIDLEVEAAKQEKAIEDSPMSIPETPPVEKTVPDSVKEVEKPEENFTEKLPTAWSVQDVYKFVKDIPSCADYAEEFRSQEIDGKALLLLKLDHIVTFTSMKVGPAIKLISLLDDMKEKFSLEV